MLIVIVGGALAVLGLLAAIVLVAAPLGWVAATPGLSLWVLFPLFTLIGYGLLVAASRDPAARVPTRLLAIPLLLVALLAAFGLVASGAGLVTIGGGTATLWYVLVLGGLFGATASAISRPRRA